MSFLLGVIIGAGVLFVVLALVGRRQGAWDERAQTEAMAELQMRAIRRSAIRQMLQTVHMGRQSGWEAGGSDFPSDGESGLVIDEDPR